MIRTALVVCAAISMLAACASTGGRFAAEPGGTVMLVDGVRDYASPHDVPARFQHLVDWHAGTEPVVLLLAVAGTRACAVTSREATRVVPGRPYRCRWRAAR